MKIKNADCHLRWCPFTRTPMLLQKLKEASAPANNYNASHDEAAVAVNRFPAGWQNGATCLGADCMAWRWIDKTHGVCGLAGPLFRAD